MLASQELREYERSSSELRMRHVDIKLRNRDISLILDVPDYGVIPRHDPTLSTSQLLQIHTEFKKLLQPDLAKDDAFYKRCAAEVNVINLFFPDIKSETIRICFTAWLVFVIAMDDILETLPPLDGQTALLDSIRILLSLPEEKRDACRVLQGHINEIRFLQGQIPNDLPTYLGIRTRTIALNPFFEIIKAEFLPENNRLDAIWDKLETEVCRAAGLQNDLIGLERDLENGEPLNAVIVLMTSNGTALEEQDDELFAQYIEQASAEHNRSTAQAMELVSQMNYEIGATRSKEMVEVSRHIILMCETHLKWCTTAKRYSMKTDEVPSTTSID
ncbi:hypothetical protein ONZ43_g3431 [Nemania bipapillata]|uniref:Uncharacterized protein n=1 Tax=Nemania bipapillata TaxID=110536 RepID=A0ACC2IWU2_9PEZI|nr:hypothetical protein ONZ43_g3431 [Nemania bipapillata]